MNVFFCADLHLGHAKICEMTGRPFSSVPEMNEALIANHNSVVKPDDIVWFLGDVAMGQISDSLPLVARMNGTKHLILGNHDRPSLLYHHKTEAKRQHFVEMYSQYFASTQESTTLVLGGHEFLLHHLPYNDPTFVDHAYEGRYSEHQPLDDGETILLHGHVHTAWKRRGPRMINVGVDMWNYTPVHADQILDLLNQPV